MKRYIRIYLMLVNSGFSAFLAYRPTMLGSILSSVMWSVFGIISMFLLTSRTSSVFGWSRYELILLSCVYNVLFGVFYFFFTRNFWEMQRIIHFGLLDSFLLKPINSQFSISFWYISVSSIIRLAIGLLATAYVLSLLKIHITVFVAVLFCISLVFGSTIMYAVWFMVMSLLIWKSNLSNLLDLLYMNNGVTKYPEQMYKRASIFLYIFLFPFTLIVVVPTKVLLSKATALDYGLLVILSGLFLYASHRFWKYALRFYASAN